MLKVSELHAYYPTSHVLHGVNLNVESGQIVALLGRNGMGKTTTLRSIMGLLRTTGQITFGGQVISQLPPHKIARTGISYVPEDRRVFASLTVEENIRVAAEATGSGSMESLEMTMSLFPALAEKRNQKGTSLSGGQQQMLAIARGLACEPRLLLLDEPTEGLSPNFVQEISRAIIDIRKQGVSIILVEQNLHFALAVSDHCYVLSKGTVVYEDTSERLRDNESMIRRHLEVGQDDE
jgi:branched-chain amino acid transport system ATP-binding protein